MSSHKPSVRDGSATEVIQEAAKALAGGQLVVFPTETVYGLGADGLNRSAVEKIFQAKGRPADHPVILHVADIDHAKALVRDWPPVAQALAEKFWPGPLTLILKRAVHIPDTVTGGQDTVGIRVPAHPVALSLLKEFSRDGSGVIAAPSANRFGGVSPTRARDVVAGLGDFLGPRDMILDGGDCEVGLESTIVDLSGQAARILRPGGISRELIDQALAGHHLGPKARPQADLLAADGKDDSDRPRVSGSLESHYSPKAKTTLLPIERLAEAGKQALAQSPTVKIAVVCMNQPGPLDPRIMVRRMPLTAKAYAQQLYAALNDLDEQGVELMLLESPPESEDWEAVLDRLRRACATRR